MLKLEWLNLYKYRRQHKTSSLSQVSEATGIAASTIAYHDKRQRLRSEQSGTTFWDTEEGQVLLKRMIISLLYTFGIKGGVGAGRIKEHLENLCLSDIVALSRSSILRMMVEICSAILLYKQLQEEALLSDLGALKDIELVLGVDETWLAEMILVCQDLPSGYLFFEQESNNRDTDTWFKAIKEQVLSWGMRIKGLVSDRATALVKLEKLEYLNTISCSDLFHFGQDIGKMIGLQLGKKRAQVLKKWQSAKAKGEEDFKEAFEQIDKHYQTYRQQIRQINKTVHPLNEQDEWSSEAEVSKGLYTCVTSIGRLSSEVAIDISVEKASKVTNQIPSIAKSVQHWIDQTKQQLQDWVNEQRITWQEHEWLRICALPYVYWQIQLIKTQAKASNQELRADYKKRAALAEQRYQTHELSSQIDENRQKELLLMAHQQAISFQRASSQTEGRNGYLAFVNHAHRGFPKDRLKVLTVIHNYDIKRTDGSTPAQRLFKREFPDLFEFICENVTGFKEPKSRKRKALKINILQR